MLSALKKKEGCGYVELGTAYTSVGQKLSF